MEAASESESENTHEFSTRDVYDVLSDKRRRYAIHYLKQQNRPVDVGELAEQVAAWENNKPISELDSQERKRVYISLYQSHLSTLDEEGLVDYDKDRGIVELTDAIENTDIYLELVSKQNIPWSYFYMGLSISFTVLLVLAWQEVGILRQIPPNLVGLIIIAGYAITAVVQTIKRGRMKLGDEGPPPELKKIS